MATGAEAAQSAAGHTTGMPQLDPSTYPNQIFWLIITLLVIYWVLSRIALPRIGAVLAERAGTISNDIAAAEEISIKAREAEAAYEKALAEARAEANRIGEETRQSIKAELASAMAEADAKIAERTAESEVAINEIRAHAAESIRQVAAEAAAEIVQVMGAEPDASAIETAVDQRVKG